MLLLPIALLAATISSNNHRKTSSINDVIINIDYDAGVSFVDESDILGSMELAYGGHIEGEKLGALELGKLETVIRNNPYVFDAEAYVGLEGVLYVQVVQKQPILRVINSNGVGYYLSKEGDKIPLTDKFTPKVLVVSGQVEEGLAGKHPGEEEIIKDLLQVTEAINGDKFFKALIDQIHVNGDGSIVLVPKIGCKSIMLGKIDHDLQARMEKLRLFYEQGLMEVGFSRYKSIDLRFKDQIVCTKN
jgi:cell division protein FtsQ